MSSTSSQASHLHKRVGKYFLGRTIGEGTYAKVKYGQHADSGEAVAIKVLDKERLVQSGMVEQIKREITILKQIHHPHIVNLLEVMSSRDKIFMVLELVTGGELFDKVVAEGPMKEHNARRVFSQLLDAVGYCHQKGVYHRDIKPENVLLSSNGAVKLSDFGLGVLPNPGDGGRDGGQDSLLRTTCGTPNYVAPEVLAKRGYIGGPADVWSLGVLLYVILAGCLPFDEDDLVALFHKISAAQYEVPPWLSPDAVGLLQSMMNPEPADRPTIEQLWAHPWMRSGLARRSVVTAQGWQTTGPSIGPGDPFAETLESEIIKGAYRIDSKRRQELLSPQSRRKVNAFELLKSGLDISGLFEAREDVVTRHTRFSSRASLATILGSIESAAVAVGGRAESRDEGRLRLHIPNPRGVIHVLVEVVEVLPGTHMVDLQKVKGNTVEFHKWYADLTAALSSIISKKQPGAAAVGGRAAAAQRREQAAQGGQLRKNAFELISSSFNIGAMFEEEQATSRHVQFSSRRSPAEILAGLEAAAEELGGSVQRLGDKRTTLTLPVGGGRSLKLQAHLFEVLPGVHVCQLDKGAASSSLDFMRCYTQLASRLQPIMMKRNAFPTAQRAAQLLATSASMDDTQRLAIEDLPPGSPSAGSEGSLPGGGSQEGSGLRSRRLAAASLWGAGITGSASRASLTSVPEERGEGGSLRHVPADMSSSSSSLQGGSTLQGDSPRSPAWSMPLPPLAGAALPGADSAADAVAAEAQREAAGSSSQGGS